GLGTLSAAYPFGFADPEAAITALALIARGVSAVMGAGIVALVYATVLPLAGRTAGVASAATVAVSPAFVYYGHTSNVDTPSLFWCALGLFAFGRLVQGRTELRHYVLLGFAVGMAAATKEQTVGLFLLVPLSVLALHARRAAPARSRWRARAAAVVAPPVLAALAASIATFTLATHLIFNWQGSVLRFRWRLFGIHPQWGTDYPFAWIEVSGPLDAVRQAATHALDAMNPVLFVVALIGAVVLTLRHAWARHFLVPLVSYLAFAVLLFDFFRARFVMQLVLVLAIFAGPVLAALAWRATRSPALAAGLVLVGGYSLAYGADVDYLLLRDARYGAERWLAGAPSGTTVETYGNVVYLPRMPRHLAVQHQDVTEENLRGLRDRAPEYVLLTSAHFRHLRPGSPEQALVERLLRGDFGYHPVRRFATPPMLTPPMIQGLSPEVVVLGGRP
ncbi:MAG TPA: glycosyltransferase family 39 protein, partial [Candidatus Tectomicrobia bacterium]|nr:glycosyltransferase family 39 protein [Candidatus Tectomicrobia bacterium]